MPGNKISITQGVLKVLIVISLVIICCTIVFFKVIPIETFGAESNPTGNPLGGGDGYRQVFTESDRRISVVINTKEEFFAALSRAKPGDVIYLPESANIDLTGIMGTSIPEGVTIASNRGADGSPGGRIFQNRSSSDPTLGGGKERSMFYIDEDMVRITGLRLEGPDKRTNLLSSEGLEERNGISLSGNNHLEVDNCELSGWSWSGVRLISKNKGYAHVHHNYIHHCQATGFGYGVVLYGGNALVEGNIFDYVKNPVAGAGHVGEGYEARYNLVNHTTSMSHSFDIHPYINPDTGQVIAGSSYKIHHNTVNEDSIFAVGIVGVPLKGVWIDHNKFQWVMTSNGTFPPVSQTKGVGRIYMTRNLIGTPEVLYEEGPIYIWYS